MAGIKHSLWGMPPGERPDIKAGEEEWYKHMATTQITNCKLCGGPIHQTSQDTEGKRVDWAWEKQNELHQHCYQNYIIDLRNQQQFGPPS